MQRCGWPPMGQGRATAVPAAPCSAVRLPHRACFPMAAGPPAGVQLGRNPGGFSSPCKALTWLLGLGLKWRLWEQSTEHAVSPLRRLLSSRGVFPLGFIFRLEMLSFGGQIVILRHCSQSYYQPHEDCMSKGSDRNRYVCFQSKTLWSREKIPASWERGEGSHPSYLSELKVSCPLSLTCFPSLIVY